MLNDKEKILSGILNPEEKTYTFEKEVTVDGEKRIGTFKAKYLSVAARLRVGTLRAKLLEGAPSESVDVLTDDLAYMISYLTVALVQAPVWWDYDKLEEIEDLKNVYLEVNAFVNSFRRTDGQGSNVGDSETSVSEEAMEDKPTI